MLSNNQQACSSTDTNAAEEQEVVALPILIMQDILNYFPPNERSHYQKILLFTAKKFKHARNLASAVEDSPSLFCNLKRLSTWYGYGGWRVDYGGWRVDVVIYGEKNLPILAEYQDALSPTISNAINFRVLNYKNFDFAAHGDVVFHPRIGDIVLVFPETAQDCEDVIKEYLADKDCQKRKMNLIFVVSKNKLSNEFSSAIDQLKKEKKLKGE